MKSWKLAVGVFVFAVSAFAQGDRGAITGTVADPAGALVPSAPITARNIETGALYETVSTGKHQYRQLHVGTIARGHL